VRLQPWSWGGLSLGLGAALGITAAALLGRDFRLDASWGTLLGTGLLGIGLSQKLGLSPLTTMFAMGVTVSFASPHRSEIVEMTRPTERAVLLPALVLAGAKVDFSGKMLIAMIVVALLARSLAKLIGGLLVRGATKKPVPAWVGVGLLPTGGLSIGVALSFALRFPGHVGDAVLATTAAVMTFGEIFGPSTMRAALDAAGELRPAGPMSRPSLTEPHSEPPL
jgi:Kef-type K+ transport system membrane component KefB